MDLGLAGKVALVGASSKGLGKASALALAREGARVTICARTQEDLRMTAEAIQRAPADDPPVTTVDLLSDPARRSPIRPPRRSAAGGSASDAEEGAPEAFQSEPEYHM